MNNATTYRHSFSFYMSRGLSLLSFLCAVYLMKMYPEPGWLGVSIFVIYTVLLIMDPKIGFFILTALLPILDFGIWTGNILFSEYDIFFLLTLACFFWRNNNIFSGKYSYESLFFILLIWYLLCCFIGFFDYYSGHFVDDVYQSPLNSVRVGKGFISAWIAWYVIRASLKEDYRSTLVMLGSGILCGLFLLSLGVLWERHVFSAIVNAHNIYGLFATLLDFSSTYRITGLFSGMHVGGTALDGYLVCILPLVFYIVTHQKKVSYFGLSIFVFSLGLYSIIVTFTRMTIASFAVSLAASGILFFINKKKYSSQNGLRLHDIAYFLLFGAVIVVLSITQKQAGYQALLSGILVFFTALMLVNKVKFDIILIGILLIVGFLLGAYGINDSIIDSQWHQNINTYNALIIAIVVSAVMTVLGVVCGVFLNIGGVKLRSLGIPVVIGCGFLLMIVGMGSTRMTERMQGVSSDLQTRSKHWADVIDSAQSDNLWRTVWGFGMGSMPKLYYQSHFDKMPLPNYRWGIKEGKAMLEIGKGGYPYYQKVMLKPDTVYNLVALIKFENEGGAFGIDICHKHILFSDQWQPNCVKKDFRSTNTDWQTLEWSFNSGRLGSNGWLDWPPTLQIHNYGSSVISIDSVEVTDASGQQIIRNSGFDKKLTYWFWISDFEHLPWHSKQLFIQIWLEQGWGGLLLFLLLISYGFRHQLLLLKAGETIPLALLPSMIAMICLGLTDEYIDEPQTTLMTFTVLFAALQWPERAVRVKIGG